MSDVFEGPQPKSNSSCASESCHGCCCSAHAQPMLMLSQLVLSPCSCSAHAHAQLMLMLMLSSCPGHAHAQLLLLLSHFAFSCSSSSSPFLLWMGFDVGVIRLVPWEDMRIWMSSLLLTLRRRRKSLQQPHLRRLSRSAGPCNRRVLRFLKLCSKMSNWAWWCFWYTYTYIYIYMCIIIDIVLKIELMYICI